MKITICGSMIFAKEMLNIQTDLEKLGHDVLVPISTQDYIKDANLKSSRDNKIEVSDFRVLIKDHFDKIDTSDAVLALNFDKNDIKNYIGSSALAEITYAFTQNKKLFLYNDISNQTYISDDLKRIGVIAIKNDLTKIL